MSTAPQDKEPDIDRFDEAFEISRAPDELRQFITLYEQARCDRLAPVRSDLNLRELSKFLPDISILERTEPGVVLHRLMGTGLVERMGQDFTGMSILPYIPEIEATRMELGIQVTGEIPCCTFSIYENTYSSGHTVQSEALGLPLDRGNGERPFLFLGLHRAVTTLGYRKRDSDRVLGNRWIKGIAVDLGYGVPDSATMEILTRPHEDEG